MTKQFKDKKVFDNNGNVAVSNLNNNLLAKVVERMKRRDSGACVARNFVYGTSYPMMVIDAHSDKEGPDTHIEVALWTDKNNADFYTIRSFIFKRTETGILKLEDFCESVSGSSAIWDRDLIGNFFIGHITQSKSVYDKQVFLFENLVVDRFLGRIDPLQVQAILPRETKKVSKKPTQKIANLLDDEDEE